ncbi:hypothetical protein F6X81_08515, partial [Enterococcus faecium]
GSCNVLLGMFLWLKTLYRKRAVTWPFIFYTIIWTLSKIYVQIKIFIQLSPRFLYDCIKNNRSLSKLCYSSKDGIIV